MTVSDQKQFTIPGRLLTPDGELSTAGWARQRCGLEGMPGWRHDAVNDIINIGKVSTEVAMVIHIDYFTCEYGFGEFK